MVTLVVFEPYGCDERTVIFGCRLASCFDGEDLVGLIPREIASSPRRWS